MTRGLAMMKVSMALNGTLPDEKLATPEHVVGTSFVLCNALLGPDGLGDRERVLFIGTQFSILYIFMYSPA